MHVVAHVIEYRLLETTAAQGFHHAVHIRLCRTGIAVVTRLVVYFYGNYAVVVGIRLAGIAVFVAGKSLQVAFLNGNGTWVVMNATLGEVIRESPRVDILFGITVAKVGLCRQHHAYAPLLHFINEVVEQVEMFVFNDISLRIGYFHVPHVNAECVKP